MFCPPAYALVNRSCVARCSSITADVFSTDRILIHLVYDIRGQTEQTVNKTRYLGTGTVNLVLSIDSKERCFTST